MELNEKQVIDSPQYECAIAIIKAERVPGFVKMTPEIRHEIAYAFAAYFRTLDKEKFNERAFLEACSVDEIMLTDKEIIGQ